MHRLIFCFLTIAFVACDRDTPTKPIASAPAGKMVATVDAPAEPTNLRVEAITDTSARVAWDAVEGATDYDVNYRTLSGRWTNEPHKGTRLYNTIYDLEPNTEYRWAVRAENSDGPSDWVFAENFTTLEATEFSVTSANLELGGSVEGDREALEAIYQALMSDRDPMRGWLTRIRLGKWECVEANSEGRVVSLSLPCRPEDWRRLPVGELPPELGDLTHLEKLVLHGHFIGQLPEEIGQLTQLKVLELGAYSLDDKGWKVVGPIPQKWANLKNLRVLKIVAIENLGLPPEWIGDLSSLEVLDLGYTYFDGPIPNQWGRLSNLRVLKLRGIEGPLPPELGQLGQLDTLRLEGIKSGSIPPEWGNMTNLKVLLLKSVHERNLEEDSPRFGGEIPAELGNLRDLEALWLYGFWEGGLPASFGQLTSLKYLELGTHYISLDNRGLLSGPLPPQWSSLKALKWLALINHELEGSLPTEWVFMESLERLQLQGNFIEGPLSELWGQMKNLKELDLSYNFIDSPLPAGWCNMDSLEKLTIVESGINGELPPEWSNLSNLKELNLEHNEITGTIPSSWVQMESLEWLDLDYNNLSGIFPSLRGMKSLRTLHLSGQNFTNKVDCPYGGEGFSSDLLPIQMLKTYTDRGRGETYWDISAQGMYFCPRDGWRNDDSGSDHSLGG